MRHARPSSSEHLLERLLTTGNTLGDWVYDIPKAKKAIAGYTPKIGASAFGAEASLTGQKQTETTSESAAPDHSI